MQVSLVHQNNTRVGLHSGQLHSEHGHNPAKNTQYLKHETVLQDVISTSNVNTW